MNAWGFAAVVVIGLLALPAAKYCLDLLALRLTPPPVAGRPVPCVRATALSDERFCMIWREWPADDERFLAVQQLLSLEILDAIDRVSDVRLAGRPEHTHAAGGLEHLLMLAANLDAARAKPEQWTRTGARPSQKRKTEDSSHAS